MHCPDPQCNYEGYIQSGLCPKCSSKLLPTAKLFKSSVKPRSLFLRIVDFLLNIFFRTLESILVFVGFYFLIYGFIILYNLLCGEIPDWRPIDFYSQTMYYVKVGSFLAICFFVTKFRWRFK